MGDFERTFGAGADAVDIIESFSSHYGDERADSHLIVADPTAANCLKCGGTGRLRQFKHIDNGKCFSCSGTGVVRKKLASVPASQVHPPKMAVLVPQWLERQIFPLQPHNNVRLGVPLQFIKKDFPTHDCFGTLGPAHRRSVEMIERAIDEPARENALVSIGDIARAFSPGEAVGYALRIRGIDRREILGMVLPSAETAAQASQERGLRTVVAGARYVLDTQEAISIKIDGLEQTYLGRTSENSSKNCAKILAKIVKTGLVGESDLICEHFPSMVLIYAREAIELAASEAGLNHKEADSTERTKQVADIASISPFFTLSQL